MKQDAILGKTVKDGLSNFCGTAIGRATYLYSVPQILISQDLKDSAERPKEEWFPEPRVKVIECGKQIGFDTAPKGR